MAQLQLIIVALALLAFVVLGSGVLLRRIVRHARHVRNELSVAIHDHALRLDQRCDYLQEQLTRFEICQQTTHLFELIAQAESSESVTPEIARNLRQFALELRAASLNEAEQDGDERCA